MHYNHHCNGTCGERLDAQAKTIRRENLLKNKWRKKYHELLIEKTHLAIKAGKQVAQLQKEKRELIALVNRLAEENKRLKCGYTKASTRSDANWDGGRKVKVFTPEETEKVLSDFNEHWDGGRV